jgi:hypothetical protein
MRCAPCSTRVLAGAFLALLQTSASTLLLPDRVGLPGPAAGDHTGCSVATMHNAAGGDFAVVGACDASNGGVPNAGVVRTFEVDTQDTFELVVPPLAMPQARFGTSVALGQFRSDGILLVGAPGEASGYSPSVGFVYVFRFSLAPSAAVWAKSSRSIKYLMRLYAPESWQQQHLDPHQTF